ncbi:MAG TPA: PIG-L family deacetylase [Acidobacteriaceae bacterium]
MRSLPYRRSTSVLATLLATTLALPAQQLPQLQDPANLASERVSPPDLADTLPINHGAPALQQLLRKLRTRASFMLIVAHPDDEDNGMLTYLSRGQGARVATLTLNRGEGGQNLMSSDFEDALGLIRTQELLAADRYMAVDQFFGSEVDFGFSKTKEEAFTKWTHDRVLYDAVRAVRLYRPLVIASVFMGEPSDGHGQHQVAGQIAQEVFNAAGNPSVFPDMGLPPWQPLKVYARAPFGRIDAQGMYDSATGQYVPARFHNYVTGKVTEATPKANVVIPEGDTDPLLGGISYAQLGREGRGLHRSQMSGGGGGGRGGAGRFDVSYHRNGSRLNQPDGNDSGLESGFFDGIDTTLPGIAALAPEVADKFRPQFEALDQHIAEAQRLFNPANLELAAPPLREALKGVDAFIHELENQSVNDLPPAESYNLLHELRIKRVQLNNALLLAHGIALTATLENTGPTQGLLSTQKKIEVKTSYSSAAASVKPVSTELRFLGKPAKTGSSLATAKSSTHLEDILRAVVNAELPPTRPYFSRPNTEQPYYDIADPTLRNAPVTPAPLTVSMALNDSGVPLTVSAIVADPTDTKPRQPAVVVPPVSLSLANTAAVIPLGQNTFSFSYTATNPNPMAAPQFRLDLPPLWFYTLPSAANPIPPAPPTGRFSRQTAEVKAVDPNPYQRYPITVVAELDGHSYREGFRSVGYPGLTLTNYYTPTVFHVAAVDLQTAPNLNVAYVPGSGDDVPTALEDLGVHPHILAVADLKPDALKSYDAVLLGVRAYEVHPDLAAANPVLNDYAKNGGIVITQYNTGRLPEGTGPYPLNLGDNEKVVEETAAVRILNPANPLLSWPNQITPSDFHNWVEERGHGFMGTWDQHYTPLLETHDAGQKPQLGGLLYARTGKGAWIYLGLALYRQFPEGVPGPYRLLANLISTARNPRFTQTQPAP